MQGFLVGAAFWALAVTALAQVSGDSGRRTGGHGTLVLPSHGVPLSLEVVESETRRDGFHLSHLRKIYRDAAGRTRVEPYLTPSDNLVQLIDPVKGMLVILEGSSKVAHRMWFPKTSSSGTAHFVGFLPASAQTENLARLVIAGIECEGQRVIISKSPSEIETEERWFSIDLGVIALTKHSGPDGERVARVQNLMRGEPDAALFAVPQEYTIRDLNVPEN